MIIPVGFVQVNLKFTGTGVPTGAEMTFGSSNESNQSLENIADSYADAWNTSGMDSWMSADVSLTSILVKKGPNATGASGEFPYAIPGSNSSADPPQSAVLLRKVTEQGGRRGRGRSYMPGVPGNACVASGELTSAYIGFLQTSCDAFLSALETAVLDMYLLHADGTDPYKVIAYTVQARSATQRRRNRR